MELKPAERKATLTHQNSSGSLHVAAKIIGDLAAWQTSPYGGRNLLGEIAWISGKLPPGKNWVVFRVPLDSVFHHAAIVEIRQDLLGGGSVYADLLS